MDLSVIIEGKEAEMPELVLLAERSLKEEGFFVIKNHGIGEDIIKQLFGNLFSFMTYFLGVLIPRLSVILK